jgi:hypothetical protein
MYICLQTRILYLFRIYFVSSITLFLDNGLLGFILSAQILLIIYILFYIGIPFWSINSQFAVFNLFSQIIPYFLVDYYYIEHAYIMFITQIITIILLKNKYAFNFGNTLHFRIKDMDLYILLFLVTIFFTIFVFPVVFYFNVTILVFLIIVAKKSNYSFLKYIIMLVLFYYLYTQGIVGSERRFFVLFSVLIYMHLIINFNMSGFSNIQFIIMLPFAVLLLMSLGIYRVFKGDYIHHFFDIINNMEAFLKHIDVGMYILVYDKLFNSNLQDIISEYYITGFSYERIFYMIIPRSIWITKPDNLSTVLANATSEHGSTSLALGIPAELFLNFGQIFFVLFTYILLYIFVYLDFVAPFRNFYWRFIYIVSLALFLSIYRGASETTIGLISFSSSLLFATLMCISFGLLTLREIKKILSAK